MAVAQAEQGVERRRGRPPGLAPRRSYKLQVSLSDTELAALDKDVPTSGADSRAQLARWRIVGRGEPQPQPAA